MASVAADGHADAALIRLEQPQSHPSRGDEEMKDASAEPVVEGAAVVDEQQQQASSDVARMSPEPAALAALRLGCTPPGSGSDNGAALQHSASTDTAAMQDVGEHKSGVDSGVEEVAAAADPTDSSIGAADALVLSPAPSPQPSPKSSGACAQSTHSAQCMHHDTALTAVNAALLALRPIAHSTHSHSLLLSSPSVPFQMAAAVAAVTHSVIRASAHTITIRQPPHRCVSTRSAARTEVQRLVY